MRGRQSAAEALRWHTAVQRAKQRENARGAENVSAQKQQATRPRCPALHRAARQVLRAGLRRGEGQGASAMVLL